MRLAIIGWKRTKGRVATSGEVDLLLQQSPELVFYGIRNTTDTWCEKQTMAAPCGPTNKVIHFITRS